MSIREKLLGKTGVEIVSDGEDGTEGSVVVTKKENAAVIGYIGVKPESRGKGVGSALLEEAENWATKNGADEIGGTLIPVPGSEETMVHLVKKNGYEVDQKGNVRKKLS